MSFSLEWEGVQVGDLLKTKNGTVVRCTKVLPSEGQYVVVDMTGPEKGTAYSVNTRGQPRYGDGAIIIGRYDGSGVPVEPQRASGSDLLSDREIEQSGTYKIPDRNDPAFLDHMQRVIIHRKDKKLCSRVRGSKTGPWLEFNPVPFGHWLDWRHMDYAFFDDVYGKPNEKTDEANERIAAEEAMREIKKIIERMTK